MKYYRNNEFKDFFNPEAKNMNREKKDILRFLFIGLAVIAGYAGLQLLYSGCLIGLLALVLAVALALLA